MRGGGHPRLSSFRAKKINLCQYVIKPAFTLAETLITLAVIGIVAAMTLPSLVGRYQEKVTVNKLKLMKKDLLKTGVILMAAVRHIMIVLLK